MRNLDAFDQKQNPWWAHISNEEVRRRTDQSPLTDIICSSRLKFFGHIARADPSVDHSRALRDSLVPLPRKWNRPSGRLRHTWLRTVESDLAPLNIGLTTTYLSTSTEQSSMEYTLAGTATFDSVQGTR